jgi:hypothetical protein
MMARDNDGQKILPGKVTIRPFIEALRTVLQRYLSQRLCLDLESLPLFI